jgi:hypothetical protein
VRTVTIKGILFVKLRPHYMPLHKQLLLGSSGSTTAAVVTPVSWAMSPAHVLFALPSAMLH